MRRILFVAAGSLAGALGAAGLIMAAPASAQPVVTFDCAPCVGDINNDGTEEPIWNEIFASAGDGQGPWETVFDPNNDGNGAWEQGVNAVNGGAWEQAFPPAE
jgi:hypothetical protein